MYLEHEDEENRVSLSKFESMLRTNKVFFFDSEEFENIILHYLDSGKTNLAHKALKIGLEQHPKSTGLKLVQVEMLVYEDKFEAAERILNELEQLEPNNEEIYIQRSAIYSKKGKHEEAIQQLKIALTYTDDLADVWSLMGMEYLFEDDLINAREAFINCLEHDIDDQSALYNTVYCYEFLDDFESAIIFLEDFINERPYSEIAWHQLGRMYFKLKNFEKALWAFDYAVLIDEEFMGAVFEKAKCLERLGRYEEAIACYQETLMNEDEPSTYALLRIGVCFEKLGNLKEALTYFSKAVHDDPLLDKGWIAITDFYIRQKNYRKALYYVNKALGIDHENERYWKRFAQINRKLGYFDEAALGYQRMIELGGNLVVEHWAAWADMIFKLGDLRGAQTILIQAGEYLLNAAEIEYRLAGISHLLNDMENALFHLHNALHSDSSQMYLLQKKYPEFWNLQQVQKIIKDHFLPF